MSDFTKLQTGKAKIFHVHVVGEGILNKFNGNNHYVCGICLPKKSEFVKDVMKLWKENKPYQDSELKLFKDEYVRDENGQDTNEKTGNVIFFAKSNLKSKQGKKKIINLYDAHAKLIPDPESLSIGNGTIANVSVALATYNQQGGGMSAYLNGIQILKLVEYEEDFQEYAPDDDDDEELFTVKIDLDLENLD